MRDRLRSGRLHRIHRGVYAVGHEGLSNHGRWKAAVIAYGPEAWLSHRSAAELWGVAFAERRARGCDRPPRRSRAARGSPAPLPLIAKVGHDHPGSHRGHDAGEDSERPAPSSGSPVHRRALRQAEYLGLPLDGIKTDHTRSDPERDFLRLCRRHHLPRPEVNAPIGPYTVDFLWREQRLVVEIDGRAAHRGRRAFEDDHERELYLHGLGYQVRRFTPTQAERRPSSLTRVIELALGGHKLSM